MTGPEAREPVISPSVPPEVLKPPTLPYGSMSLGWRDGTGSEKVQLPPQPKPLLTSSPSENVTRSLDIGSTVSSG